MFVETTAVILHDTDARSPEAAAPLEALVAEVGATYPLMAYTLLADEADEAAAIDAAILAGLVAP